MFVESGICFYIAAQDHAIFGERSKLGYLFRAVTASLLVRLSVIVFAFSAPQFALLIKPGDYDFFGAEVVCYLASYDRENLVWSV
jgi:hypothetical protein